MMEIDQLKGDKLYYPSDVKLKVKKALMLKNSNFRARVRGGFMMRILGKFEACADIGGFPIPRPDIPERDHWLEAVPLWGSVCDSAPICLSVGEMAPSVEA